MPLREQPVGGGEVHQLKHVLGAFAKEREEMVEGIRHEIPRGAGVEAESVNDEFTRAATDLVDAVDDCDCVALTPQKSSGGQPGSTRTDHECRA